MYETTNFMDPKEAKTVTATILGHQIPIWQVAAISATAILAGALIYWLVRRLRRWNATIGVKGAALVALMATGVSMDTNWLFWGTNLHVTNTVLRALLFADLEEALLVFAIQARENKLRPDGNGKQGIQGVLVWVMSGIAMFPAWIEAGVLDGTVRAVAGPLLAATLWHFALGLEFKVERPKMAKGGMLAALARNLRERLLARVGVLAPDVSALEIRQDRALADVVRLTIRIENIRGPFATRRRIRLLRRQATAMRRSGAADDPGRQSAILRQLAVIRHASELATLPIPSPWAARLTDASATDAKTSARTAPPNARTTEPAVRIEEAATHTALDESAQRTAPKSAQRTARTVRNNGRKLTRLTSHTERTHIIDGLFAQHGPDGVSPKIVADALGIDRSNGYRALQRFLKENPTRAPKTPEAAPEDEPEQAWAAS